MPTVGVFINKQGFCFSSHFHTDGKESFYSDICKTDFSLFVINTTIIYMQHKRKKIKYVSHLEVRCLHALNRFICKVGIYDKLSSASCYCLSFSHINRHHLNYQQRRFFA